jgi:hypothetical protein
VAGVAAGVACLIVGLYIADHAAADDSGPAVAGTVLALIGVVALIAGLALIGSMMVAAGAGRLRHWLRRPGRRAPGGS